VPANLIKDSAPYKSPSIEKSLSGENTGAEISLKNPSPLGKGAPCDEDDVARLLLQFLGEKQPVIQLTPEEVASFAESRARLRAASLRPTNRCALYGQSTAFESTLHAEGTLRRLFVAVLPPRQ
jgi:hypothetical protein